MYEKKGQKLLPWPLFARRIGLSLLITLGIVFSALFACVLGYHTIAKLPWIDSILNASMILTGMGPVDPMRDTASKLFASAYAIFSGVVFLSAMGVVLSPIIHRIVHAFHVNEK